MTPGELVRTVIFITLSALGTSIVCAFFDLGAAGFYVGCAVGILAMMRCLDSPPEWIRRVKPGQFAPNGISLRKGGQGHLYELMLLLPFSPVYKRRHYVIYDDYFYHGWYVAKLFVRIGKSWGAVVDIRISIGLSPLKVRRI